jgi:regulator of RNase E activity RraA
MTPIVTDEMKQISARLERCYTGILFDVMRDAGRPNCVLPYDIRPLIAGQVLAGPIFTISGRAVDLPGHETLLRWTEFLSVAPPGFVVVSQPNDDLRSHMGELSSETLTFRGVKGYVVDGGCRDVSFIEKIGFPVFCRYKTPRDIVGTWVPEKFGEPIEIGSVAINSGDYVMADSDGVVIIPADMIEQVVSRSEELINTENLVRKAILEGEDPKQAYLTYGKF